MGAPAAVIATYQCTSPVRDPLNVGTEQSIAFDVDRFDPLTVHVDRVRRFSRNGQRFASTIRSRYRTGEVSTPVIELADVPHWIEFYDSVAGDELFILDATQVRAVFERLSVFIPSDSYEIARRGLRQRFRTGFDFRVIEP